MWIGLETMGNALVETHDDCTCDPAIHLHEPYCGVIFVGYTDVEPDTDDLVATCSTLWDFSFFREEL